MRATATAQPNIALIKYWGKRDLDRNLPAVGSISITLSDLRTEMTVDFDAGLAEDELTVNGEINVGMLPRVSDCLDRIAGEDRLRARVLSKSNFPIAAGLASSASSFAALTVAAACAGDQTLSREALARLAGRASGSAARSLYGGFAELANDRDTIAMQALLEPEEWPMHVVVAVTDSGPKPIGSTEAMEISRTTSPFYERWIADQDGDLTVARDAIAARDFAGLAAIAEHNCLKMHSIMWASRPPTIFWNSATMRCLQTIRRLQDDGVNVFFTIDAGPQVKAVCLPDHVDDVSEALRATTGVKEIMTTGLGVGARVIES